MSGRNTLFMQEMANAAESRGRGGGTFEPTAARDGRRWGLLLCLLFCLAFWAGIVVLVANVL